MSTPRPFLFIYLFLHLMYFVLMYCFECCCILHIFMPPYGHVMCFLCLFSAQLQPPTGPPDGWLRRIDPPSLKSDEQNINLRQIYWFETWFLTSTNAGNESLASSLVMDKENSCHPKVTRSSDTDIHSWYKQVIADLFFYLFTSHLFIDGEHTLSNVIFPQETSGLF